MPLQLFLLLVAFLPLFPVARLLLNRGVRRRLAGFPPMWGAVSVLSVFVAAALIIAATRVPELLLAAASISTGLMLYQIVQTRTSRTADGLPPGSLAFLPEGPWKNPEFYREQARRHGPVFKFRHFTSPAVGMIGMERIAEFLRVHGDDLIVPPAPFNSLVPGGFVRYLSGAEHDRIASTLRSAMSPAVIEQHDDSLTIESRRALESIRKGADTSRAIEGMVSRALTLLFLGTEHEEHDRIDSLFQAADYRGLSRTGKKRAGKAVQELIREMRQIARHRGKVSFLSQLADRNPAAVEDDAIMGNLAYALHTGRVDVRDLLMWAVATAGENADWMRQLRNDIALDRRAALRIGGLADRIVRETLRLHQSEFLIRRSTREIRYQHFRIPEGWHVRLCIAESHRLDDAFENAEAFNPDRFTASVSRSTFAPFGFGRSACPGEHLTRAIGRHFVAEAARSYEMSVSDVEPLEFTGFHWAPGSNMKVKLDPISA